MLIVAMIARIRPILKTIKMEEQSRTHTGSSLYNSHYFPPFSKSRCGLQSASFFTWYFIVIILLIFVCACEAV